MTQRLKNNFRSGVVAKGGRLKSTADASSNLFKMIDYLSPHAAEQKKISSFCRWMLLLT